MNNPEEQRKNGDLRGLGLALLIALPLYIFGTFNHDLWRPAEAREAGIAREMIENGNWVATYLNGNLFLEKPPLYTWAIALPLQWLGYREWVVRIPVFLFTLGTLVTVYWLARRRLGVIGAQGALVSLATMWLFLEVNHGAMIDNGLVFFVTLAMFAFHRMSEKPRLILGWAALFYGCLGLAFLCKGAVGPLLILVAVTGFVLSWRQWSLLRSWHPALGMLILLLLVGGWLWALWLKGGAQYFHVFFIDNHLQRFLGQTGPVQPWHYYLPLVPAAIFPWVILTPAGIWMVWRQWRENEPGARPFWSYLFWWIGAMLAVLSIAGGKDNQYLLPLLPPLALICGAWVEASWSDQPAPRWCRWLMGVFAVVAATGVTLAPLVPMFYSQKILAGCLAWSVGLGMVAALVLRALWLRQGRQLWAHLALLVIAAGAVLGLFIEPLLNKLKTSKPLAAIISKELPPGAALWGYDLNENLEGALIFYGLRPRRITTLAEAADLARQAEPAVVLLYSRNMENEFKDQIIRTGQWQVLHQAEIGGRHYWLMEKNAPDSAAP